MMRAAQPLAGVLPALLLRIVLACLCFVGTPGPFPGSAGERQSGLAVEMPRLAPALPEDGAGDPPLAADALPPAREPLPRRADLAAALTAAPAGRSLPAPRARAPPRQA